MTALTQDKNTPWRAGKENNDPVAAATKIFAGSILCLDANGNAVPGATSTTLTVRGRAEEYVDNSSGADGDETIQSSKGVFQFANDGTIARVDIKKTAYIVDDQTVADNDGVATRSVAGTIVDVDADGVWIEI